MIYDKKGIDMALRTIRELGDSVLTKKCKEVKEMTSRLETLINDMLDTMYDAEGVGLAAPQVGILKRVCVVDTYDEDDENAPYIMINPVILAADGEQTDYEGCLSYPGMVGEVTRANHVVVRALDINMEPYEVEAEGLLARAFQHEIDHLDGMMYVEKVNGDVMTNEELAALRNEETED